MRKIYNYGQIIRAKRQNKNIKAITLAKDLGITAAYLSLIESNEVLSVEILDLSGAVKKSQTISQGVSETKLDLTNLTTGLYLVNIKGENEQITKKLLIQ